MHVLDGEQQLSQVVGCLTLRQVVFVHEPLQQLAARHAAYDTRTHNLNTVSAGDIQQQEGLAVASMARDDPSALPSDDPFPPYKQFSARARMHRDRNAR